MTARAPLDDRIRETREAGAVPVQRGRKAGSILAAARKLFLDHGFDAVAMDMVAQQAPVSKATLYAHFSSKEELFTAVVVDEAHRVLAEVWRVAPERADIGDMLRHIAQKFVDIFLMGDAMSLHRAVIGVVPRFPAIGAAIFESGPKALTGRLAEFLAEAHRQGRLDIPNPPLAANQFLSLVRGDLDIRGLLLPATPPGRAEIEAQVDAGIDLFLRFYAPSDR
jgi:TetR/AcrR family transcriptional repressor of mexJK operon